MTVFLVILYLLEITLIHNNLKYRVVKQSERENSNII